MATDTTSVTGALRKRWIELGSENGPLGKSVTGTLKAGAGAVAVFERGCLWHTQAGGTIFYGHFDAPLLGQPLIVNDNTPTHTILRVFVRRHKVRGLKPQPAPSLADIRFLRPFLDGRLVLTPVGKNTPRIPIRVSRESLDGLRMEASGVLANRQLYDIGVLFRTTLRLLSPHAVYVTRQTWNTFTFAHITDLHVCRRADRLVKQLATLARRKDVRSNVLQHYNNFNDRFRDFIRFANQQHALNRLDLIFATGDLVDYIFEPSDDRQGGGNFEFFRDLVLGKGRDPNGRPNPELKVPLFTTLGNHDYRENPYPMVFAVSAKVSDLLAAIPIIGGPIGTGGIVGRVLGSVAGGLLGGPFGSLAGLLSSDTEVKKFVRQEFLPFNLTIQEAQALEGVKVAVGRRHRFLTPEITLAQAGTFLDVNAAMLDETGYYFRAINRDGSFMLKLGPHRFLMLNTRYDSGVTKDRKKVLAAFLGFGADETVRFVHGFVNSEGLTNRDAALLKKGRSEAGVAGIVLVGLHSPPLCHWGHEFSHFFRETEHRQANPANTMDFLLRTFPPPGFHGPIVGDSVGFIPTRGLPIPKLLKMNKIDPKLLRGWRLERTAFFRKAPRLDSSLFQGAMERADNFLRICAGGDGGRTVNVVLCGHEHRRVEYKVKWMKRSKEFEYYMDFYTENPKEYYESREHQSGEHGVRIRVSDAIKVPGPVQGLVRTVPAYPNPLKTAPDANAWWRQHSPVIIQTASLGPIDINQLQFGPNHLTPPDVAFQGIRMF